MGRHFGVAVLLAGGLLAARGSADDLDRAVEMARQTLDYVERSARQPTLARELESIERQVADAKEHRRNIDRRKLYEQVRKLRRRIILSHPLLDFDKILVNQRTCQVPGHMCDQYLGCHSRPGPGLTILENWKDDARATVPLEDKLPPGMTYHPELSYDAKRVVFAFCTADGGQLRAFYLYEAAVDGSSVRQLTGSEDDPMEGALGRKTVVIEDYDPCYLPDGGIAFISTRSQQFGRCHGSRYVPSYCLYRCDADGSNVRRLSFNEANEWNPSVMTDGRIIYTRWDYINRHDTRFQSLWVMRPDGTGTAHYYGNYSSSPCMIAEARSIPGSHKIVATGTDHHGCTSGTILVIDPRRGEDGMEPLLWVTPEFNSPEGGLGGEITKAAEPLRDDLPRVEERRIQGRAATPYPLSEELFLVAYPYEKQYAVYLIDIFGGRELIYYDPEVSCFNPIPVRPTPMPPPIPSEVAGKEEKTTGRFFVQDVYQSTQPTERGTIRRLRVNAIIPQPTRSKPILSAVSNEIIKRVLGTVPVERDGSVAFEAPASSPLQLQLLDENGMAVMTMRSLVYLQPGEEATCIGCHEPRHGTPVSMARMPQVRPRRIEPPAGPRYDGGFSFGRSVQPVLDRYCIECHGLGKTEGGVNLIGSYEDSDRFTRSYDSLVGRGDLVKLAHRNGETWYSKPKDYFAHAGKLAHILLADHPDKDGRPLVELDRESFQRIVDWLDLNGQFYGDYSFNRIEDHAPVREAEQQLRDFVARRFGGDVARQPYAALVNKVLPEESRILKAPLDERAGGWGQMTKGGFSSTRDPAYRELLELVKATIRQPEYHDIAGTCGRENGCRCGCCYVRVDREAHERRIAEFERAMPEAELSVLHGR